MGDQKIDEYSLMGDQKIDEYKTTGARKTDAYKMTSAQNVRVDKSNKFRCTDQESEKSVCAKQFMCRSAKE